ncbi:NUDIX hydrolase [Shimazuella kribbensis]|uniref:NUDIX hydrolase n=1 Tax=Shimazuella kribbensis TaxID=139808 RepID=UPI001472185D|nr:NUDIX hydrolase [Shimazuella kribbensis]
MRIRRVLNLIVVRVYLINRKGELLVLTRSPKDLVILRRSNRNRRDDLVEPPGGCVEMGEGIAVAAARETQEETGMDIHQLGINLYPFSDSYMKKFKFFSYRTCNYWGYIPHPIKIELNRKSHVDFAWISKGAISSSGLDDQTQKEALRAFAFAERERGFSY